MAPPSTQLFKTKHKNHPWFIYFLIIWKHPLTSPLGSHLKICPKAMTSQLPLVLSESPSPLIWITGLQIRYHSPYYSTIHSPPNSQRNHKNHKSGGVILLLKPSSGSLLLQRNSNFSHFIPTYFPDFNSCHSPLHTSHTGLPSILWIRDTYPHLSPAGPSAWNISTPDLFMAGSSFSWGRNINSSMRLNQS